MLKKVGIGILGLLLIGLIIGYPWIRAITGVNTQVDSAPISVYLGENDNFEVLVAQLLSANALKHEADFRKVAKMMDYGPTVRPGHYLIKGGMTSRELIIPLRIGKEDPVRLTTRKARTINEIAGQLSKQLALDSSEIVACFSDPACLESHGLTKETVLSHFISNTYEVWWSSTFQDIIKRMDREKASVWNESRKAKAAALNLTPEEVMVIASLIEEEQSEHPDEWPRIAGLYLNRVKRRMRMESDPTIKFALQRFDIKRVLYRHIDDSASSPYNTYRNDGIPPGPICTTEIRSIDAVLNAEQHNYIFMCAKADFSGYHAFATNLSQHNRNARLYQKELDRLGY